MERAEPVARAGPAPAGRDRAEADDAAPGRPGHPARRLWAAVERVHAVVYFAPEVGEALVEAGLRGFWRGYFAARAAPLGPVPAEVVTAVVAGFHPAMVSRAVPDVWSRCPPARVLEARRAGAAAALARVVAAAGGVGSEVGEGLAAALEVAAAAVARLDVTGRPLAAANREVALTGPAWARLWQCCTTLREHRGDGHVAALVAAGLSGLDAHVLAVAVGAVPRDTLQRHRGWSDGEWEAAVAGLAARGLVDAGAVATSAGVQVKAEVEAVTDVLALAPWHGHAAALGSFTRWCAKVGDAVDVAGTVPYPNPMGLPAGRPGPVGSRSEGATPGAIW